MSSRQSFAETTEHGHRFFLRFFGVVAALALLLMQAGGLHAQPCLDTSRFEEAGAIIADLGTWIRLDTHLFD